MLNSVGTSKGMLDQGGMNTASLKDVAPNCWISIQGDSTSAIYGSWLPLIIIMVLLVSFSAIVLSFTVFGKKMSSVGKSGTASLYAGINVKQKQIITMVISGLFAGLLGAMVYCGYEVSMPVTVSAKTIPQYGFNGISVGLIAMTNPIGVVPVSLLFGMIDISKSSMSTFCGVDPNIAQLMFGVIVYGAAIIAFFYYFTPWVWLKQIFYGENAKKAYQDYNEDIRKHLSNCNNTIASVVQLRKAKRNVYKLRWKCWQEIIKIEKNIVKNPYYLANKNKFKSLKEFGEYCTAYGRTYVAVLAGFADMYGRIPVYLKPKFREQIKQRVYDRYGFKWKLVDKLAMSKHCLNYQRLYLSEIFNSPSVKDNFKLFGIDFYKLNNKNHIKQIKARVWRYYVINKKIAANKFNTVVITNRKNRYDFKHCRFLYVKNAGSKMTKEITKGLKVFSEEASKFVYYNNTINLITLKFSLRDYYRSKYMTTRHKANVKTKVEGLTESNNVMHLITDRLSVEIMLITKYQKSQCKIKEMHGSKGSYQALYLINPQLAIKDIKFGNPYRTLQNINKVIRHTRRTYWKLKKFITKKESYALIEKLLINKRELLEYESKLIHLYSPYVLADLGTMQVAKPATRKGAQ